MMLNSHKHRRIYWTSKSQVHDAFIKCNAYIWYTRVHVCRSPVLGLLSYQYKGNKNLHLKCWWFTFGLTHFIQWMICCLCRWGIPPRSRDERYCMLHSVNWHTVVMLHTPYKRLLHWDLRCFARLWDGKIIHTANT